MKKLLPFMIGTLLAFSAYGQSNLPPCPKVDYSKKTDHERFAKWHNCWGRYKVELADGYKGDVLEGEWRNGFLNGQGTYTTANGEKYVGEFKDGLRNGQGTNTFASGEKYVGEYKDNSRNGQGTYTTANGEKYVGEFKDGAKNGQGINTFASGEKYVGGYKDDLRNGQGTYTFADGLVQEGIWAEDKFVRAEKINPPSQQTDLSLNEEHRRLDASDLFVIQPQFTSVGSPFDFDGGGFNDGLSSVRIGDDKTGKWGFINKLGEFVINPQFDEARSFREGFALVRIGDEETGKYGFIDKQGKIIINPQFDWAYSFQEGLASVRIGDDKTGKWGFINKQGKIVINPQFDRAYSFEEGLAPVCIGSFETGKWGFIDKKGNFVINPQFDDVHAFYEGLAFARIGDDKTGKWGIINKKGKFFISPQFDQSWDILEFFTPNKFSEGLAPACIRENLIRKCGFVSKESVQTSKLATLKPEQKNQEENKRQSSKLSLQATTTIPDANGAVIITVRTDTDTSSLRVNGEEQGGRPDGNYVIKKVARVGQDTNYVITAIDTNGNTDSTTITVARQAVSQSSNQSVLLKPENIKRAATRDAVAIIIGIQNYKRVPKAEFANNDAKEFYEYAIRGLGIKPENIKLLVDEDADEVNIVKAFRNWLPLQVTKNKTDVYVFYSGHGLPAPDGKSLYFLPHGVDEELLDRTAVGQNEIVTALISAIPKSVTMFIDACYSGKARGGETLLASAKPMALKADANAFPLNFTVITASANDQISSSSPELKHGIFSFYLMKGMEGDADGNKDGKITAGEMQDYLSDKVSRQAMSMSRKQDTQLV